MQVNEGKTQRQPEDREEKGTDIFRLQEKAESKIWDPDTLEILLLHPPKP